MTAAELKIRRARSRLIDQYSAYGALAIRLQLVADDTVAFMSTDGTRLRYNPAEVERLPEVQVMAGFAHEASHCALLHPWRVGGRDVRRYNVAADHVINLQLLADGMTLWPAAVADPKYAGKSTEQVYALIEDEQPQDGQGQPQPGQPDFEPAPADGQEDGQDGQGSPSAQDTRLTAADWQAAAEQAAMVGRKAGTMSDGLARAMKAAYASRTDWRTATRRWLEQFQPSDYSWAQPDRRYLSLGYVLPGVVKENMPVIGLAVDTSGSIRQEDLDAFSAEATAILHELRPERLIVVYVDSRVQAIQEFTPEDPKVVLTARGGGGTDFQPALTLFAGLADEVAGVIYLTDLMAPAPKEPRYPVLWGTPERYADAREPFGERIVISRYA